MSYGIHKKKSICLSIRGISKKFNLSASKVFRIKQKYDLKSNHKFKVPRREDRQHNIAISHSRKLYKYLVNYSDSCLIMDDETYCITQFNALPGTQYYSATERYNVADKLKINPKDKLPKKYLVWQAICQCGRRSDPFICSTTMTSAVYLEECLKKRLLPFIASHGGSTIFWPDLATCHYSRVVNSWYEENEVICVPKTSIRQTVQNFGLWSGTGQLSKLTFGRSSNPLRIRMILRKNGKTLPKWWEMRLCNK